MLIESDYKMRKYTSTSILKISSSSYKIKFPAITSKKKLSQIKTAFNRLQNFQLNKKGKEKTKFS